MFSSIGIMEIIVIAVVTILIVKPEDFPGFLRKIGHYYGKFHSTMFKFKNYTKDTFDQITNIETESSDTGSEYDHSDYHDDDPYSTNDGPDHTVSMDDNFDEEDEESGYDLYFSDDDYCEGYDEDWGHDDDDYGEFEEDLSEDSDDDYVDPEAEAKSEDVPEKSVADTLSEDNESSEADVETVETEAAAG